MTDPVPTLPTYPTFAPDEARKAREKLTPPQPTVTVNKPIRFRVGTTRPGTRSKHYARKARTPVEVDRRDVTYY